MARRLDFVRLTEVAVGEVMNLLNEPRNARHMPLSGQFSEEATTEWVAVKDAQWEQHGYGPWAVLVDGELAGWGGFQREENGADFALVLLPKHWGIGLEVTEAALERGFRELGLSSVIIALPFTRSPARVVARLGFVPDGEVSYGGADFRQYRLSRAAWEAARSRAATPTGSRPSASTSPASAEVVEGAGRVAARATTSGMPAHDQHERRLDEPAGRPVPT